MDRRRESRNDSLVVLDLPELESGVGHDGSQSLPLEAEKRGREERKVRQRSRREFSTASSTLMEVVGSLVALVLRDQERFGAVGVAIVVDTPEARRNERESEVSERETRRVAFSEGMTME